LSKKIEIPEHIAIVMDGNGRWAKDRGLARTAGHEAGEKVLFDLVEAAIGFGVKELSAYAFSTENWKRTPEEVKFLMGYSRDVLRKRRDRLNEMGVKIQWIGRPQRLWKSVISELEEAQELTRKNKTLTLNMCVNYGGRSELVDATTALARDVKRGKLKPDAITERQLRNIFTHRRCAMLISSYVHQGSSAPATSCRGNRSMPSSSLWMSYGRI
jgi:undecaprenyl diphosphate synthase